MKSELSSMWHDIERLEFVLTDVLRMRTMDVVSFRAVFDFLVLGRHGVH